jgi:D-serine deaminase-like pyridoxal phosphate-dependent protein
LALVDIDAFDRNARALVDRAHGKPIRVATKSVRCRALIRRALSRDGFKGLMCYSVEEALWWARDGQDDIMVAYPSVDVPALAALAADPALQAAVAVMVDSVEHVDLIAREIPHHAGLRVAIDVDASLRIGPAHLGVRRSPLRTVDDVEAVVRRAGEHGLVVAGLMFYDAQIAGLPDSSFAVRQVKSRSDSELRTRRAEIVAAVRRLADLDFVNGGGTGSLHVTGPDPSLTELAAGSGLYAPTLFDGYDGVTLEPAAFFGCPVVRRPSDDVVTVYSGGYIASGPPGWARVPHLRTEGTGEVQTPLKGAAAARLQLGDRIWFRHAKAGELAERFTHLALVRGGEVVEHVPTYRGEGQCFG